MIGHPVLGFPGRSRNTVIRSAFGVFYSAEANIFDDLGFNPPQLTFPGENFNSGTIPTAAQLVSTGFPIALPPGQTPQYQWASKDHRTETDNSPDYGMEPERAAPVRR